MLLTRDDNGEPGSLAGAAVEVGSWYRKLLVSARQRTLKVGADAVRRIEKVFDQTLDALVSRVKKSGGADLHSYGLARDLSEILANYRQDYAKTLNIGMVESAQDAAGREAEIARQLEKPVDGRLAADMKASELLSSGARVSAQFGRVALTAVEVTARRIYSDGWQLSDRLYKMDQATRQAVQDVLVKGITDQSSAREVAKALEKHLAAAGAGNPRYQAMRIARTELVTSHREAHLQSVLDPNTGRLKDWVLGIGWRLSLSHPHVDICDVWAADDGDGLGEGVYLPQNVPSDHPHGLCSTYSVLVDVESEAPGQPPKADQVPKSQVKYYAEKYDDPTAQRWIEKRGLS